MRLHCRRCLTILDAAVLLASFTAPARQPAGPVRIDDLGIVVQGSSRQVAFTNTQSGVFTTQTNAGHRSGWEGWRVRSRKILDDYALQIDGRDISRTDAVRATVYPDRLVREYPDGLRETVTLLDSVDALVVELDGNAGRHIGVRPLYAGAYADSEFTSFMRRGLIIIKRLNEGPDTPDTLSESIVTLGISPGTDVSTFFHIPLTVGKDYSPLSAESAVPDSHYTIVFAAGRTQLESWRAAGAVLGHSAAALSARRARIEQMLNRSPVITDDPRFDKALNWAKVSLDALIMNQGMKGIFAGLPWFDNYWGRDSYISLPGAALVTGNFADAQAILRSFAALQDTNPQSPTFGRIPNQVTTTSVSYNTADGTPRFVIALDEYVRYSGDSAFARELWPVVLRSIEGTLKFHTDSMGFLTHGDAETWMDAVGPDGAWSPRGNRANDIQALWYRQLRIGAGMVPDPVLRTRWQNAADRLARNFQRKFVDRSTGLIADHLTPDGMPDKRVRPNQLFAIGLIADPAARERMFAAVTRELVYPYGVGSLSGHDENFRPYHDYPPFYVPDAAYHNGIVWTWLAGPWIDCAVRYGLADTAFRVTSAMVNQILDRGAVGTLSELLDAAPRPGESEPRLSGAFSQAWSLAEFIRTVYQDYLGIDVRGGERRLILSPRLPASLTRARVIVPIGTDRVEIDYRLGDGPDSVSVRPVVLGTDLHVRLSLGSEGGEAGSAGGDTLGPGRDLEFTLRGASDSRAAAAQEPVTSPLQPSQRPPNPPLPVRLAAPVIRPGLKALKAPDHRLLKHEEVKQQGKSARVLYDVTDPEGDDRGPGGYTYPLNPNFRPGSFDITHFTVSADSRNVYFRLLFRNLSDPGWHPEYGFQLTYVALAIDKDRRPGSGETCIGMNAQYRLKKEFAFETVLYIGGGIRIMNSRGKTLAEYVPSSGDESDPLGSASRKTIEFSVPIEVLGTPAASWRYTVLVGAQDDHGGAGLGEFRSVGRKAAEWSGGGKTAQSGPNVYDELLPANP